MRIILEPGSIVKFSVQDCMIEVYHLGRFNGLESIVVNFWRCCENYLQKLSYRVSQSSEVTHEHY